MKKYRFSLILLLGTIMTIISCSEEEYLERNPFDDTEASVALQTNDDFTFALRGVQNYMLTGAYWSDQFILLPDVMADNVTFNPQGRQSRQVYSEWRYTSLSAWNLWTRGYQVVYAANNILAQLDVIDDEDFRNDVEAEARALRANAIFDLVRTYSKIPTQSDDADGSLGVPYPTEPISSGLPQRDLTVDETYDLILDDLNFAAENLPSNVEEGRINNAAVYGLLSRVHLYNGSYEESIEAAENGIDAASTDVATKDNFPLLWVDESDQGILWKLRITDQDNISPGVAYSQTGPNGVRSEYVVSFELFNLYEDDDVRKDTYIETSDFDGDLYNHVAKYFGRNSGNANVTDMKVVRIEELYLNIAEASYQLGEEDDARDALDVIRDNRYDDYDGDESGDDLEDAINLERRLEFAFEATRFYTLKRQGKDVVRTTAGEFADGSGTPPAFTVLPNENFRFQMAIPQAEINVNPTFEQNPGY